MNTGAKIAVMTVVLGLAGCATLPNGPSVMVLPGRGKTFEQFRQDDLVCRQFALNEIGGKSAQKTANQSTLKSAAVGALLGGALGTATDNGRGAGIGAATGALLGTAIGSSNGYGDAYGAQHRYDNAYEQCMYAKGNRIPVPAGRSAYDSQHEYPPPPPGGRQAPYSPPPPPPPS